MKKEKQPLVSIIILAYNNYKYIFDALNSVLIQDYPNIEIVINNDGSQDFNESEIILFLNKSRNSNITHVFIKNQEHNLGTVRCFNYAIKQSTGSFLIFLAADDALAHPSVVSDYVNYLQNIGENAYISNSQVQMYDEFLQKPMGLAFLEEDIDLFKRMTPHELYREMCVRGSFFPSTCCIRRELFNNIDFVCEDYRLIEDAPLYLSIFRNDIKVYYLDKITLKHRHGGLVHGNKNNSSESLEYYYKDELLIYKKEILPFSTILGTKANKVVKRRFSELEYRNEAMFQYKYYSLHQKFSFIYKHINILLPKAVEKTIRKIINISLIPNLKRNIAFLAVVSLLLSNYTNINIVVSTETNLLYKKSLIYFALLLFLIEIFFTILSIARLLYKQVKHIVYKNNGLQF